MIFLKAFVITRIRIYVPSPAHGTSQCTAVHNILLVIIPFHFKRGINNKGNVNIYILWRKGNKI